MVEPDLSALLKEVSRETQIQFTKVFQDKAVEDNCKIQVLSSMLEVNFKLDYHALEDLIFVGSEDLKLFCKCLRALEFRSHEDIRRISLLIKPAKATSTRENRATKGPTEKKKCSRGKSCKAQDGPPHNPPILSNKDKSQSTGD